MTVPIRDDVPLAPLTTLELGGHARHFVEAADDDAVIEALRWAEGRGLPVLILGGGSNVVIADRGFDGLVVRIATRGRRFDDAGAGVTLTAAAGEPWDDVVAESVARNLAGLDEVPRGPAQLQRRQRRERDALAHRERHAFTISLANSRASA